MADSVTKTIYIKGVPDGVDETTASVNKLSDAMASVSVQSDTTSKLTLGMQSALDRQQRSLDATYRAQQQYDQSQRVINQGVAEGLISQDRANQLMDLAAQKFDAVSHSASPAATAVKQVQLQLVALAGGLGPVGVVLASFGPVGLVAAAGITLIVDAIENVVREADRLGELSRSLRDVGESANLTTTQVQALQIAGAAVGLDSQQIATGFEKFNTQLAQLKDGSGNLLTTLDRISPALALQLSATRDSASAWNILATAYAAADRNQQALIQHAIAGNRGGAGVGRLLGATAAAGGVDGLTSAVAPADIIPDDTVQRLADLKTQIDQIKQSTANIWASIYSQDILEKQKQSAQYMHDLAVAAKDLADAGAGASWLEKFVSLIGGQGATGSGAGVPIYSPSGLINRQVGSPAAYPPPLSPELTPPDSGTTSPATEAANYKVLIQYLGVAATAYEQQHAKVLELDAALAKHTITQETYNRAVAGLNLQTVIQLESQRISLLGQGATVEDLVAQKQDEITSARQRGVIITAQEAAGIIAYAAAQKLASDTALLTTNNVVTAEQLRAAKFAELNAAVVQNKLTQDQATTSLQAYQKVIEQTIDAQTVAKATFTNLAQLQTQAGSLRNQFDTFSTDTSNNIGAAFLDIATGAKTAKQAFADLEAQVVKSLLNMVIQFTIVAPIAKAFEATLGGGGFLNLLNFGSNTGVASTGAGGLGGVGAGFAVGAHHAGGIVGGTPTFTRYVHPAYFDDAPRFHSGGIAGDEVPIIAQRGEGVFTPAQMAALGSRNVTVQQKIQINNTVSHDTNVTAQPGPDPETLVIGITRKAIAQGHLDSSFRGRYSLRPNKVR